MCHTIVGVVLTTGTNLGYGQKRNQVTGSDTPLPQHLRYVTQGTPESSEKKKTINIDVDVSLYTNQGSVLQN